MTQARDILTRELESAGITPCFEPGCLFGAAAGSSRTGSCSCLLDMACDTKGCIDTILRLAIVVRSLALHVECGTEKP